MRVAIVGSGGREHALAWKLEQSPEVAEVVVLPGNGGTPCRAPVDAGDVEGIRTWCVEHGADLVVVGPEAILAAGLVDALEAAGVRAFGPCRQATRLESSKVWAKELMARHGVSTAPFGVFETVEEAQSLLAARGHDAVLKYGCVPLDPLRSLPPGGGWPACHAAKRPRPPIRPRDPNPGKGRMIPEG